MTSGVNSKTSVLAKMATKYIKTTQDGAVQSLQGAVDVVRARILDLMTRIDASESPQRMKRIVDLWQEFNDSFPNLNKFLKSSPGIKRTYENLEKEMMKAYHDYESWEQIFNALDLERKLSVDQIKILKEMRAILTAEQGMELVAKMIAAAAKVLKDDPDKLKQLSYEFGKIVGDGDAVEIRTGSVPPLDVDVGGMDRGQILHPGDIRPPGTQGEDTPGAVPEGLPE